MTAVWTVFIILWIIGIFDHLRKRFLWRNYGIRTIRRRKAH